MKYWGKLGAGLALLALLTGCGGGGGGDNTGGTNTPPPIVSVSVVAGDGLTATLTESAAAIAKGGSVIYTEVLKNTTAKAIVLNQFASNAAAPDADLTVLNSAGIVVYSSSQLKPGQNGPPAPPGSTVTLSPGQSLTLSLTVTAFAQTDTYAATAIFHVTESGTGFQQNVKVGPLSLTAQ